MNQFTLQNPWPFRDKELIGLWNKGLSTKAISETMGLGRNQVLGRVKRLRDSGIDLTSRGDPVKRSGKTLTAEQQAKKERDRARRRYREKLAAEGRTVRAVTPRAPRVVRGPVPDAPEQGTMTFANAVDQSKCLWSYGDLKTRGSVCGLDKVRGSRSYCAAHDARATDKKTGGKVRINYQVRPITGVTM